MGIPDLLKFVARDAPKALRHLPKDGRRLEFDHILVDLTNALSTLGVASLRRLLCEQTRALSTVVFVLDGQRDRQGTQREGRQFMQHRSADTAVVDLAAACIPSKRERDGEAGPSVVVLGRDIAGEGDFKLLSYHRRVSLQSHGTSCFLFVSEDSDVFCGALCGPFPAQVTLATTLHDTLHDVALLDVGAVSQHIAGSVSLLAPLPLPPGTNPHRTSFGDDDDRYAAFAATAARGVTPDHAERARRVHSASLDFVFLFALVLGQGSTPPLSRGATRVDAASCWRSYCTLAGAAQGEEEAPAILSISPEDGLVSVNAAALAKVLDMLHFADERSRQPVAEERKLARAYLKHVVQSVVHCALGAPYDGRKDEGLFPQAPSLSAIGYCLFAHDERRIDVPFSFDLTALSGATLDALRCYTAQGVKRVNQGMVEAPKPVPGHSHIMCGSVPLPKVPLLPRTLVQYRTVWGATHATTSPYLAESSPVPPAVPGGSAGSASARYSFDMRRVVPVVAAAPSGTSDVVLRAAGIATSYFDEAPRDDVPRKKTRKERLQQKKNKKKEDTPAAPKAEAEGKADDKAEGAAGKKKKLSQRVRRRLAREGASLADAAKTVTE